MNELVYGFFAVSTLFALVGGVITVAATNPIRGAMGLLATIVGIAGLYLLLSAEFLAAVQILVYAGAVVVLFLFVIMLLGPTAIVPKDTSTRVSRYLGAGLLLGGAIAVLALLFHAASVLPGPAGPAAALQPSQFPAAPARLGTIEGIGAELFTTFLVPFELSAALLLVAIVGAVAVARGRQPDPTNAAPEQASRPEESRT